MQPDIKTWVISLEFGLGKYFITGLTSCPGNYSSLSLSTIVLNSRDWFHELVCEILPDCFKPKYTRTKCCSEVFIPRPASL